MANDATFNVTSQNNYELLCDYEIMIEITSILPMLEVVHSLHYTFSKCVPIHFVFH
jgi:hypothetical protein